MRDENCIFCKIAGGCIPSNTLYEDENFLVILDIAPAAKGHAIAIAKNHFRDLLQAEPSALAAALPAVARVADAMKKALSCDGINILQNNGEAAGQSVFHLHFHIIPRRQGDGLTIPWKTLSYEDGEAEALASAIRSELEK